MKRWVRRVSRLVDAKSVALSYSLRYDGFGNQRGVYRAEAETSETTFISDEHEDHLRAWKSLLRKIRGSDRT